MASCTHSSRPPIWHPAFGDQPVSILRDIRHASSTSELRALNHRARAFALEYLESARSVDWLARFTTLVDSSIVARVITLADVPDSGASCWALCGSSGRGESLTRVMPELVLIARRGHAGVTSDYQRVSDLLADCDYLPRPWTGRSSHRSTPRRSTNGRPGTRPGSATRSSSRCIWHGPSSTCATCPM